MSSVSRPPRSGALAGVVASFWVSVRPEAAGDEVVLPSGRAQLVVDGGHGVALLVGPRTRPATVASSMFAAGMSLSGAGLRALSRVPVPELVDVVVNADVVIERGRWAQCLEESDLSTILDRLEYEALRHLRGDCALSQQVASAERAIQGGSRIDEVMSALGADRRRLVPAFRDAVGLAPKHYQRIQRFQRALRAMRMPTPPSLAEIAATCRYADQAHMSRDFKSLSGLTPSRLHGATSSAHNHIPTGLHAPE